MLVPRLPGAGRPSIGKSRSAVAFSSRVEPEFRRVSPLVRRRALTALLVLEVLLLFVAIPLAGIGIHAPLLAATILSAGVVGVIVIAAHSAAARILAALAVALAAAGIALRLHHPSPITSWLGHGATILAVGAISLVIGQAVFGPGRVTHHRIQGAIVLYLNIAVAFTSAYRLAAELSPNAFAHFEPGQAEGVALSGMLYFSFTTLTSTGFGEILPIHPLTRSLASLEAIMGQLYLTILLARLVTLHGDARRQ
jgi:hypothetical protein